MLAWWSAEAIGFVLYEMCFLDNFPSQLLLAWNAVSYALIFLFCSCKSWQNAKLLTNYCAVQRHAFSAWSSGHILKDLIINKCPCTTTHTCSPEKQGWCWVYSVHWGETLNMWNDNNKTKCLKTTIAKGLGYLRSYIVTCLPLYT